MFSYIFRRGGQARPCQTRQRFTFPLQLPSVSFLSCMHPGRLIQVSYPSTSSSYLGTVDFMVLLFIKAQARSLVSSGPSALLHVNEFINLSKLPLSVIFHKNIFLMTMIIPHSIIRIKKRPIYKKMKNMMMKIYQCCNSKIET